MSKNGRGMADLQNHLFSQLEKLNHEDLSGEELKTEIARAKGVTDIAKTILEAASIELEAAKLFNEGFIGNKPKMLE